MQTLRASSARLFLHRGILAPKHLSPFNTFSILLDSEKKDTLKEAIDNINSSSTTTSSSPPPNPPKPKPKPDTHSILPEIDPTEFTDPTKLKKNFLSFSTSISSAWDELTSDTDRSINKQIRPPAPTGPIQGMSADGKWEGTQSLLIVDPDKSAYEKMRARLQEAPIIQDILRNAKKVYKKAGVKKLNDKVGDVVEDATEIWQTSQNPWIYRISSVWDTMTAESDSAIATRELRRLDPDFDMEVWKEHVSEGTLPEVIQMMLDGKTKDLKPWLGDAVYSKLSEEIRLRKTEGLVLDNNVLGIENSEVIACKVS